MAKQKVVDLPGAGVPADNGLSSLGLIMQLGGTLLTATMAMWGLVQIMTIAQLGSYGGSGSGSLLLWTFLAVALCLARSLIHRSAGNDLLYVRKNYSGDTISPLVGLRRYIIFGLAQSVVLAGLMWWKFAMSGKASIAFGIGLAAWPVALGGLLASGRFGRFSDEIPVSEDKGFEGASVLMTIMGLCGVFAAGAGLLFFVRSGGDALQGINALLVITTLTLLVRSCLHAHAGLTGLRTTSIDRSVELANRYANFGVISSFCAAGALLMFFMSMTFSFLGIIPIAGLCWMLMAWPLIIRRFFSDRQFVDLLSGGETVHRRAPDAGLTGLGWFLLAHAMFSAVKMVPTIFGTTGEADQFGLLASTFGPPTSGTSPWWTVLVWVLQMWAGFELIRMSSIHRIVGTLFGAAGALITLYTSWPVLKELRDVALGSSGFLIHALLAIALLLPVTTLILVNRNLNPTARARYRTPAAPTTAS